MKKLYDGGTLLIVGLILAIVLGGGFGATVLNKKINTVASVDVALTIYDGLITGADVYVTECAEHVIDQSCVTTARAVFNAAEQSKKAYLAFKAAGPNPPQTISEALIVAVNALNMYFMGG